VIRTGENIVDGVPVDVERKRIHRINIRIRSDGRVHLSVPKWWATLGEGEAFLRSKWDWVVRTRRELLSRPQLAQTPVTKDERERLGVLITDLHVVWTVRLNEPGVTFRLRRMKTLWGSCHWRKRVVTYSTELARVPREMVEYVVVHELTHLQAHDHGPHFYALMDARLRDWKSLRRRLNKRQFAPEGNRPPIPAPPVPADGAKLVQTEFGF